MPVVAAGSAADEQPFRAAGLGRSLSNLGSRLLVAAIGLPVVLGLVWLGGWWLAMLAGVVGLLALHELYRMIRPLRPIVIAGYAGLVLTIVAAQAGGSAWIAGALFATVALAFLLKGFADTKQSATVAVGGTALGVTWIGIGVVSLMALRALPDHGRLAAFTVLLAVWAGDTLAYVTGRLVGRHKLAPKISPGKTWEGFVGGTAATIFVTFVALYQDRDEFLSIGQALLLGLALAVAAPLGDLFESLLKRDMGVKDSGNLLGGHGGVLDRIDAQLFAAVAGFYVILAFGKI
jgi:phosphatidate cytidylyltransferase